MGTKSKLRSILPLLDKVLTNHGYLTTDDKVDFSPRLFVSLPSFPGRELTIKLIGGIKAATMSGTVGRQEVYMNTDGIGFTPGPKSIIDLDTLTTEEAVASFDAWVRTCGHAFLTTGFAGQGAACMTCPYQLACLETT